MVFLFHRESSGRRPVLHLDSSQGVVTAIIAAAAAAIRPAHHGSDTGTAAGVPIRTIRQSLQPNPRLSNLPKHVYDELLAAGWPSWLVMVAGEAIRGWTPRQAETFDKLDKIGQGTYSNVYKATDRLTGNIVALKKVRFDTSDRQSVMFMAREILILRSLDHPNVMRLDGLAISRMAYSLYLVFEYMDHDLAAVNFTEPQVKCYMKQLLLGLEHCHERCVIHRDIKCSNLLIDSKGVLKIADFGLASFFDPNRKLPLTSKVGTLWYRSPELLLGATKYGVGVDLWSAGCVLGELLAGKPILPGQSEVNQLHKIFELCGSPSKDYLKKTNSPIATIFKSQQSHKRIRETFKDFPPSSLPLLETLLAIDPDMRQTVTAALLSDFFTTEPTCEQYSLPRYSPRKIMDIRLQEQTRRLKRIGKTESYEEMKKSAYYRGLYDIPAPSYSPSKMMVIRLQEQARRVKKIGKTESYEEMKKSPYYQGLCDFTTLKANAFLQDNFEKRPPLIQADAKGKSKQDETVCYPSSSTKQAGPSFCSTDAPVTVPELSHSEA